MEKILVDKYYVATVEDLYWGCIERDADTYKEGKELYDKLKEDLKDVPCTVVLLKVEEYEDDTYEESVVHKKVLNKENNLKYIYEDILASINRVTELVNAYRKIEAECNQKDFDFKHGLELVRFRRTTGEQRDNMLYIEQNNRVRRRAAKSQLAFSQSSFEHRKVMKSEVKQALNSIKMAEEHFGTNKIKPCDSRYMAALGLNLDYTPYEVTTEMIYSKEEIKNMITDTLEEEELGTIGAILKSKAIVG